MTWHTSTTTTDGLATLMRRIQARGGTVASCRRCTEGVTVTWFTV